jgi:1-acyl-sn-glycerol-3-phosphate acyltransferase
VKRWPLGRVRAAAGLIRAAAILPAWLMHRSGSEGARGLQRRFHGIVLGGFGVSVEVRGVPSREPGTLFVANHLSWADIAVFGATIDAHFVSKAEVADWPLLGAGAKRTGTLFVERERRHGVSGQAEAIRQRLRAGDSIILFPEGTTSDGTGVLPFRSSLFAAADAARHIQPVALTYATADGNALPSERLAEIAWTGEETLLPNAAALASGQTRAILSFLPPVDPRDLPDRKALATHVREMIVRAYHGAVRSDPGSLS